MLLPHLKARPDVELVEVATATPSTTNAQAKFGFGRFDDYRACRRSDIEAVLIATRHDSHSAMVCEALRAGKTVFVEKPLAVTAEQLAAVREAIAETGNDRLMVGFNRRFAQILTDLRAAWGGCGGPQVVDYTINAGPLEATSWYGQTDSQGTAAGEAALHRHRVWWLGADPMTCGGRNRRRPDNLVALLTYPTARSRRSPRHHRRSKFPKEILEVFGDGKVARIDNFKRAEIWRRGKCRSTRARMDKGQSTARGFHPGGRMEPACRSRSTR
jgi:predicted dehydrogenase